MTKLKRKIALIMAVVMMFSVVSMSASAASTTATLNKNETEKYTSTIGLYKKGYGTLKNDASSNDGVYLHIQYSSPGKGWVQSSRILAERGNSATSSTTTLGTASSWRGRMTSWWINGKNCKATATITAN